MYIAASRPTGQIASCPASGSRMMELANVEAARLGRPGRTTMVGRRSARPSTKPLRLARLEHVACALEVDPHAEIEVLLRIGADDRREMEYAVHVVPDRLVHLGQIGDVAGHRMDAVVIGHAFRLHHVEQRQSVDRLPAGRRLERAPCEQRSCELLADEAGTAGDHDVHR
jgi:hypothetical protein